WSSAVDRRIAYRDRRPSLLVEGHKFGVSQLPEPGAGLLQEAAPHLRHTLPYSLRAWQQELTSSPVPPIHRSVYRQSSNTQDGSSNDLSIYGRRGGATTTAAHAP